MTLRIKWDEYETALLIDAFWKIENDKSNRQYYISDLSEKLRKRAVYMGIEIDQVFRNVAGITMQLKPIEHNFFPERHTLTSSAVFDKMCKMYIEDRDYFDEILNTARNQIGVQDSENQKELLIDVVTMGDRLYEELKKECERNSYGTTAYYMAKKVGIPEKNVREILNKAEWATLQYGKYMFANPGSIAKLFNFSNPPSLEYTTPVKLIYFGEEFSEIKSWKHLLIVFLEVIYGDYPQIIHKIAGQLLNKAKLPLIRSKSSADDCKEAYEFTEDLFVDLHRPPGNILYNIKSLLVLCRVDYENIEIYYKSKEVLGDSNAVKDVDNRDATVVKTPMANHRVSEKQKEALAKLESAMAELRIRYSDKKATTVSEVLRDNKDLRIFSLNTWTSVLFDKTAKVYLIENGIIEEIPVVTEERSSEDRLNSIISQLHKRCLGKQAESLKEVTDNNPDIKVNDINSLTRELFNMTAKEYLVHIGIIKREEVIDEKTRVDSIVDRLIEAYKNDPASSVSGLDTKIIGKSTVWLSQKIREVYDCSASEYLQSKGVIKPLVSSPKSSFQDVAIALGKQMKKDEMIAECNSIVSALIDRKLHMGCCWEDINELKFQNHDLDIDYLILNAKAAFGTDINEYLYELHIVEKKVSLIEDNISVAIKRDDNTEDFNNIDKPEVYGIEDETPLKRKERNSVKNIEIEQILKSNYPYGFRIGSIREIMRFRHFADEKGVSLPDDDGALKSLIAASGVLFNNKIFCVTDDIQSLLQYMIDCVFEAGTNVIYYESLFEYENKWMNEHFVYSDDMLKELLQTHVEGYTFSKKFMSRGRKITEKEAVSEEIIRVWGDSQTVSVNELNDSLHYIPKQNIRRVISGNNRFVLSAEGEYLFVERLHITEKDKTEIKAYVERTCNENGFTSLSELPIENVLEENFELTSNTIRNAVYKMVLSDSYYINGKIITKVKGEVDAITLLKKYLSDKDRCSVSELSDVVVKLTGSQNRQYVFQALYDCMVRVDIDSFVANKFVSFDVAETDRVLKSFIANSFCAIREVTTFAMFPVCGQSWNHYLLESYCYKYSNNYSLHILNFNDKNAGIIAEKDYSKSYSDMLAIALARKNIELTQESAGGYLCDTGYMAKSKYASLNEIIVEAYSLRKERC